jgi:hypothetical protein
MICRSTHIDDKLRRASAGARFVHTCQIPGCGAAIPRRHLMCSRHWHELPSDLRDEVLRTFSEWMGQQANATAYLIARLKAIICACKLHEIDARQFESQLTRWTNSKSESL